MIVVWYFDSVTEVIGANISKCNGVCHILWKKGGVSIQYVWFAIRNTLFIGGNEIDTKSITIVLSWFIVVTCCNLTYWSSMNICFVQQKTFQSSSIKVTYQHGQFLSTCLHPCNNKSCSNLNC